MINGFRDIMIEHGYQLPDNTTDDRIHRFPLDGKPRAKDGWYVFYPDGPVLAGAFGNFLNLRNAVAIGLLPDVPMHRMRFVGNTSLAGAKLAALSQQAYKGIFDVADRTTYFELSTDPTFMDQFVAACFFPHTNIELFPNVAAGFSGQRV